MPSGSFPDVPNNRGCAPRNRHVFIKSISTKFRQKAMCTFEFNLLYPLSLKRIPMPLVFPSKITMQRRSSVAYIIAYTFEDDKGYSRLTNYRVSIVGSVPWIDFRSIRMRIYHVHHKTSPFHIARDQHQQHSPEGKELDDQHRFFLIPSTERRVLQNKWLCVCLSVCNRVKRTLPSRKHTWRTFDAIRGNSRRRSRIRSLFSLKPCC